jgi:hypothetical protein
LKVWKAILIQIALVGLIFLVSVFVLPKIFGDIGFVFGLLMMCLTVLISRRSEKIRDFMRLHLDAKKIVFGFITLVVIPIILFQATLDILPDANIILRIIFIIIITVLLIVISWRTKDYVTSFLDMIYQVIVGVFDPINIGSRDTSSRSPFERNEDERKRNEDEKSYSDKKTHEDNSNDQSEYTKEESYEILGLKNDATTQEIKEAFKQLALQWHPDKHRQKKRNRMAEEEMKKINKAYEELTKSE